MLLVCKFLLALSIIDTESRLPFLDGMLKKLFTIVYNYIDTKCFTTIEVACYGWYIIKMMSMITCKSDTIFVRNCVPNIYSFTISPHSFQ